MESLKKQSLTEDQCQDLLARVRDGQYSDKTREEAAAYVEKAKACLDIFEPGEEMTVLKQAADFVLTRTK